MTAVLARVDLALPTPAATAALGRALARRCRPRDVLALGGSLGVGKTHLARALVRALGPAEAEVPSPTFTLVQTYETTRLEVWHFDLYRLERPEDAWELGLEEALADGLVLIEWPERLGSLLPAPRLDVTLSYGEGPTARRASLAAVGEAWAGRLDGIAGEVADGDGGGGDRTAGEGAGHD